MSEESRSSGVYYLLMNCEEVFDFVLHFSCYFLQDTHWGPAYWFGR